MNWIGCLTTSSSPSVQCSLETKCSAHECPYISGSSKRGSKKAFSRGVSAQSWVIDQWKEQNAPHAVGTTYPCTFSNKIKCWFWNKVRALHGRQGCCFSLGSCLWLLLLTRGQQRGFCDEVRNAVSILFVILPKSLHEWGAQIPLLTWLLLFPRARPPMYALHAHQHSVCRTWTRGSRLGLDVILAQVWSSIYLLGRKQLPGSADMSKGSDVDWSTLHSAWGTGLQQRSFSLGWRDRTSEPRQDESTHKPVQPSGKKAIRLYWPWLHNP